MTQASGDPLADQGALAPHAADPSADRCPLCPICLADADVRHRHSIESIAAAHAPPGRDRERHQRMRGEVARLWPGGHVDVCVCNDCTLGFAWPLVAGDAAFYSVLHERAAYPRERWEFQRAREDFADAGRVLDVGAGRGEFLLSLPAAIEKHGVEASPAMCAELASRGITAHANLDAAADAGPFSLVTMFHVLQYFADPVAALATAGSMLERASEDEGGGRLLISLPNAAAGGDRIDRLTAPPHPLTRWTRHALERAADEAGLDIAGFAWIPQRPSSLLWAGHAQTRARAAARPDSLVGRIDAMKQGLMRNAALLALSVLGLPGVLRHARSSLKRSQMFAVCRKRA